MWKNFITLTSTPLRTCGTNWTADSDPDRSPLISELDLIIVAEGGGGNPCSQVPTSQGKFALNNGFGMRDVQQPYMAPTLGCPHTFGLVMYVLWYLLLSKIPTHVLFHSTGESVLCNWIQNRSDSPFARSYPTVKISCSSLTPHIRILTWPLTPQKVFAFISAVMFGWKCQPNVMWLWNISRYGTHTSSKAPPPLKYNQDAPSRSDS